MKEKLKKYINDFDLLDKTILFSKEYIEEYISFKKDEALKYGFTSEKILKYKICSCSFNTIGLDSDWCCIQVNVGYINNNLCIGYYSALYDIKTGDVIDDFFEPVVIEE